MGVRSEVDDEIIQYLRLESSARLESYVLLVEFYSQLGESSRELWLVYDSL